MALIDRRKREHFIQELIAEFGVPTAEDRAWARRVAALTVEARVCAKRT